MIGMEQRTSADGSDGKEDSSGWLEWQTAEYTEYVTEESRGWWRWHKQQHRMVRMAQRKAKDG